jgi:predicted deacetylase
MQQPRKTQFILRFDDICPTMRWNVWSEIESSLIEFGVKPILAIVPDNRDPVLQVDPPVKDFWEHARRWQELGWTIALHGYQHLYIARNGGLVSTRKKSEFASLPAGMQREKLQKGMDIFAREGIRSHVWIAPGNAFNAVTVSLLPEVGIDMISAGWFWRPFQGPHGMTWLPCQLSTLRPAPRGIWSVCYHHNSWTRADLAEFRQHLQQYREDIASVDEVMERCRPWRAKWCYEFCTSPRLSSFVLRAHLKLLKMWRASTPERKAPALGETNPPVAQSWKSNATRVSN